MLFEKSFRINNILVTIIKHIRIFYKMADTTNTVVAATTETVAQGSVPAIKLSVTVPAAAVSIHHGEKPEKFNKLNFKR